MFFIHDIIAIVRIGLQFRAQVSKGLRDIITKTSDCRFLLRSRFCRPCNPSSLQSLQTSKQILIKMHLTADLSSKVASADLAARAACRLCRAHRAYRACGGSKNNHQNASDCKFPGFSRKVASAEPAGRLAYLTRGGILEADKGDELQII
jgi:hypothetical protein